MNPSLFIEFVQKFFKGLVGKITEKINGKAKEEQMFHKNMLTEEYSADLNWGSTDLNQSIVAADVVALDSPLPLKNRGTVQSASGTIAKIGIKFRKGEKKISDMRVMMSRGVNESTIAAKVLDDVPRVIKGIDMRNEIMFLQGLSTGQILVVDEENTGTGIRVSFGYKDGNTFHAKNQPWGTSGYTPKDDLDQLFDKAQEDGNSIALVMISKKYFNYLRTSDQGKQMAANYLNQVYTSISNLVVPTRNVMLDALKDEYGAEFRIVDSSLRIQKADGTNDTVKPWEECNIVALPTEKIGRLVYGTLAEEDNPVAGVTYEKSGNYILVSKYSKTDPLEEFTCGQALCLPVIDGASAIYVLHADVTCETMSVNPSTMTFMPVAGKEIADIHYDGDLADLGVSVSSGDTWCTAKIMKGDLVQVNVTANTSGSERTATVTISDGTNSCTITVTQRAVIAVSGSSDWTNAAGSTLAKLSFTSSADANGKSVTVSNGEGELSVASAETWCTVTESSGTLTVKVNANTGAKRTSKVTVVDSESQKVSFNVEQAAAT